MCRSLESITTMTVFTFNGSSVCSIAALQTHVAHIYTILLFLIMFNHMVFMPHIFVMQSGGSNIWFWVCLTEEKTKLKLLTKIQFTGWFSCRLNWWNFAGAHCWLCAWLSCWYYCVGSNRKKQKKRQKKILNREIYEKVKSWLVTPAWYYELSERNILINANTMMLFFPCINV